MRFPWWWPIQMEMSEQDETLTPTVVGESNFIKMWKKKGEGKKQTTFILISSGKAELERLLEILSKKLKNINTKKLNERM